MRVGRFVMARSALYNAMDRADCSIITQYTRRRALYFKCVSLLRRVGLKSIWVYGKRYVMKHAMVGTFAVRWHARMKKRGVATAIM
jgi:hypothetical protein